MIKILYVSYGFFLILLTFFSYFFVDPNLDYYKNIYSGFSFQHRELTTLTYSLFIVLFFIFYGIFIWLFKKNRLKIKEIKKLIFIACLSLLFSYPAMLSYDIFNYLTTAKVLFFYHENPYVTMPIEFINEPFLNFTRAANKIALYGPVWIFIAGVPFLLGFGNFFLTLLNFKLIAVIFYFLSSLIIYKFKNNPYPVLLFALNPLIISETLISGHNDIVMIFFALAAFLFIKQKKHILAICLLTLSILIKYATIFLLPIFIFILWQTKRNKTINWDKVFLSSFVSMFIVFLLSPIREEMYPWYAIWFLTFSSLIPNKKLILFFSISISFGLILRYIPYMYSGTYFGMTPALRIILTSVPVIAGGLAYLIKNNNQKNHEKTF